MVYWELTVGLCMKLRQYLYGCICQYLTSVLVKYFSFSVSVRNLYFPLPPPQPCLCNKFGNSLPSVVVE
jgi:hypothetical protein